MISDLANATLTPLMVSVPFPGILFLNLLEQAATDTAKMVSVPFPGILFLNE